MIASCRVVKGSGVRGLSYPGFSHVLLGKWSPHGPFRGHPGGVRWEPGWRRRAAFVGPILGPILVPKLGPISGLPIENILKGATEAHQNGPLKRDPIFLPFFNFFQLPRPWPVAQGPGSCKCGHVLRAGVIARLCSGDMNLQQRLLGVNNAAEHADACLHVRV